MQQGMPSFPNSLEGSTALDDGSGDNNTNNNAERPQANGNNVLLGSTGASLRNSKKEELFLSSWDELSYAGKCLKNKSCGNKTNKSRAACSYTRPALIDHS